MPRMVNYGVIGCGMMGREHLRNIALLPDARVHAIFEPDAAMAQRALELAPDATLVASVVELLEVEEIDCVLIVSPNFRHVEQLEALADKRPLPVLVEKPLFTDPQDVARMMAFRNAYPAPVWVAMEYRYMPPIAAFLSEVDVATGGVKMLTIREHRFPFLEKVGDWNRFNRNTGGTFVEKCCHFFDLMRLVMRSEPIRIMASGGQDVNHLDESYQSETPDILDNGYVIVDFASGTRAVLELCMFAEGARYQEEISAVGPSGKIEASVPGPVRFWPKEMGPPPVSQLRVSPRSPQGPTLREIPVDPVLLNVGDHNGSTFFQHQGFVDLVRANRDRADVEIDDGIIAVVMGMAAQRSLSEHRMVSIIEFLGE